MLFTSDFWVSFSSKLKYLRDIIMFSKVFEPMKNTIFLFQLYKNLQ